MDDLYSAVEDVKLINAMTDDPRPTKEWTLPSDSEIKEYVLKLETENPLALELSGICSNCLGFYLFLRHLKDKGEKLFADFLAEVAVYKTFKWRKNRLRHARHIHATFLSDIASRSRKSPRPRKHPDNLLRLPSTQGEGTQVTEENWSQFMQLDAAQEATTQIFFTGEPLEDVLIALTVSREEGADVTSDRVVVLPMNLFNKLELVVFYKMKQQHFESFQKSPYYTKWLAFMTMSVVDVSADDFSLFRVLGRGGFGTVYGCKKCQSGHLYALKVMNRHRIKSRKAEHLCVTERNLMTMLDSPFIVGLKYAYGTPKEVHLVLKIMTGGDLGFHLRRKTMFNKQETKYYICRTILGIKALHSYNIIFRDLKPDNILMDDRGRTSLSDLGLAVVAPRNGITGACGTRGYWAPEMITKSESGGRIRYGVTVDWFSLGCVLYQFMSGISPFRKLGDKLRKETGKNAEGKEITREEAIDRAVREREPEYSSDYFTEDAIDLIKGLLKKDSKERLGAKGTQEVMNHPFFAEINWEEYADDSVKPPCLPRKDLNYASQNEIGDFSPEEQTGEELTPTDLEPFTHWSFTRSSSFLEEVVGFMHAEEKAGPIHVLDEESQSCCCSVS